MRELLTSFQRYSMHITVLVTVSENWWHLWMQCNWDKTLKDIIVKSNINSQRCRYISCFYTEWLVKSNKNAFLIDFFTFSYRCAKPRIYSVIMIYSKPLHLIKISIKPLPPHILEMFLNLVCHKHHECQEELTVYEWH